MAQYKFQFFSISIINSAFIERGFGLNFIDDPNRITLTCVEQNVIHNLQQASIYQRKYFNKAN